MTLLLEAGAQVNQASQNQMHVFPLHSAAAHHDTEKATRTAQVLLEEGATPNVQEQGGYSPLHTASANGNTELVKILLDHGADPSPKADDGKVPVDLARDKGHTEIVELFAQK